MSLKGATSRFDESDKGNVLSKSCSRLGPLKSGSLQTLRARGRADVPHSRRQSQTCSPLAPRTGRHAWIIGAIPVQLTESNGCTLQAFGRAGPAKMILMRSCCRVLLLGPLRWWLDYSMRPGCFRCAPISAAA